MEWYQNVSLTFYVNLDLYSPVSLFAFVDGVGVKPGNASQWMIASNESSCLVEE